MRLGPYDLHRPTRRDVLVGGAAIVAGGLLLDATAFNRHDVRVEERTFQIASLPMAFHGFRIAQISDFHYNHFAEDWYLRDVVKRVNALAPDMVALTGDFITADQHSMRRNRAHEAAIAEILAGLTCPLRFCTLGNHDSTDFAGVTAALERHGMTVLRNRYTQVDRGGDRLWIGGLADAYFDAPDLTRSIPAQRGGAPVVLLGHEPDIAPIVDRYGGADLLLAGHTHGGQVRLPLLPPMFLPDMGREFVEGAFQVGKLQLYVTRGIGTVHLPVRFRCPPEISLLTLQPDGLA